MVYEMLETGKDNAMSSGKLCRLLGIKTRDLTAIITEERRQGLPICATSNATNPGYFIPADQGEMQEYCKSLHHRAGEIYKTRRACLATMEKLPGGAAEQTK